MCVINPKTLKENNFKEVLKKSANNIIQKLPIENILKDDFTRPKTTEKEDFVINNFLALGEVETSIEQLRQSSCFISNFRLTENLKKNNISRFDHIIYHIEAHLLRTTGILDRILILTSLSFDLKIRPEKCKPNIFLFDYKGKEGKYAPVIKNRNPVLFEELVNLNETINDYREIRNEIAHQKRYKSEDLKIIEMLDLGFRDENHKQKDKNLNYQIKRVFDLAVSMYKKEMIDLNNKITEQILNIYNELVKVWSEEYEKK